jgi:hypothetical protein
MESAKGLFQQIDVWKMTTRGGSYNKESSSSWNIMVVWLLHVLIIRVGVSFLRDLLKVNSNRQHMRPCNRPKGVESFLSTHQWTSVSPLLSLEMWCLSI